MKKAFACALKACSVFCLIAGIFVFFTPVQSVAQDLCWCCIDGKVVQIPAQDCKGKGGRCYASKDEALKNCQENLCWCCIDGTVLQLPPEHCKEKGGRCFLTRDEAIKNCRQDLCWCCIDGKVVQIPAQDCKEKGGRCYVSKDEATKNCQADTGKICCIAGKYNGVSIDDPKCEGGKTGKFILVIEQPNCGRNFSGKVIDPDTGAARSSISGTVNPAGRGCCRLEGEVKGLPGSGDDGCIQKISATICIRNGKWVVNNGTYTPIAGHCCGMGTFKMEQI